MIPRIIHQTWKTADVPRQFQYFQRTWRQHHPDWEYRLWTDQDNRAFLARFYPEFLPIYDGYLTPICRVDAIRCFLLKHFGGVYADLDFECLQPLDALLEGKAAVVGLEPRTHALRHGFSEIVCNAFMASRPGHPFWDHVIQDMVAHRYDPDPLDATGPFLLTRAYHSYDKQAVAPVVLLPATVLYPADSDQCADGQLFDLERWIEITRGAVAMHHWSGTWYQSTKCHTQFPSKTVPMRVFEQGKALAQMELQPRSSAVKDADSPLISCLMVTTGRVAQAIQAIRCFQAQTYPARELVVLDDSGDNDLAASIQALDDPTLRHIRLPSHNATLGALRNQAVALAAGEYVCQWDDDDLYDPARLATQMLALQAAGAAACILNRWVIWWPHEERVTVSPSRPWEGSLLCLKSVLPAYPELRRGEDTPAIELLMDRQRVVLLDQPRLYLYVVHGSNTFQSAHFASLWQSGYPRLKGADYQRVKQELSKRLDLDEYLAAIGLGQEATVLPAPNIETIQNTTKVFSPAPQLTAAPDKRRRTYSKNLPEVLILTPLKNAARFVPRFFELTLHLEYPRHKLSLAFLEGDSSDDSLAALEAARVRYARRFASIELFQEDLGFACPADRCAASIQYRRRAIIAHCRNQLFKSAHRAQPWVLWIDADVIDYPPDILLRLLATHHAIVTPHCVHDLGGPTFDLNTFKFRPEAAARSWLHLCDSIIQPRRGVGRWYLEDFRGQDQVELDSVGGTMLLVKAALHAEGILFPAYSYRGFIESEGFAAMAKDRGYQPWGLPDVEIIHARE